MVELLLRALFEQGTLPEPALVDELMAVCAQPILDKHAQSAVQRSAAAEVAQSPVALLAPLCCALAPLVQETPPPAPRQPTAPMSHVAAATAAAASATAALGPGARFWFMLLDRDADGELGGNDLFFWLNAPASATAATTATAVSAEPPPVQSLIESLVRVRSQEASQNEAGQEGGSFRAGEAPRARVELQACAPLSPSRSLAYKLLTRVLRPLFVRPSPIVGWSTQTRSQGRVLTPRRWGGCGARWARLTSALSSSSRTFPPS